MASVIRPVVDLEKVTIKYDGRTTGATVGKFADSLLASGAPSVVLIRIEGMKDVRLRIEAENRYATVSVTDVAALELMELARKHPDWVITRMKRTLRAKQQDSEDGLFDNP